MELTNPVFLCKVSSDRVADTCVACDQGGSCGNSFFYIRRTLPWPEFHGIPPDCRQMPYKKAAKTPWFQQCRTQASFGSFSFFYDLESKIMLSKKQRFHRAFFDAQKGFFRVLFKVCGRIVLKSKSHGMALKNFIVFLALSFFSILFLM